MVRMKMEKLVKVVAGNRGSRRITIPKEICEKLELEDDDYVVVSYNGNKTALITPVEIKKRK